MTASAKKPKDVLSDRETEKRTIRLSVRAFVEFLLRSGDISPGRGGWADREAMQAGARVHRRIQKSRGAAYRAEVPLQWQREFPLYVLSIEGRADGIFAEDGVPVIEEIKGTYADVGKMEAPVPVHLAQARCYAYIYSTLDAARKQEDGTGGAGGSGRTGGPAAAAEEIGICMTYVQLETEEVRRFAFRESVGALEAWFTDLVRQYMPWAEYRVQWAIRRNASIRTLEFPFFYREGQKGLVADIYRTILRRKQVFVQAPTGVGKTVSALYPAVRAMGEGLVSEIFYLTAKNTTGSVAEETFALLKHNGLCCKLLTMTAREKICLQEEVRCDPLHCPCAAGHYDRINELLYRTLTGCDTLDRETIRKTAEEACVCPYELQADLALFADAIIADYNYAFDLNARLRAFFGETQPKTDRVFLIDEAHNLADRGREMFSAELSREEFLAFGRVLDAHKAPSGEKLRKELRACAKILLAYRKESEENIRRENVCTLAFALLRLTGLLEDQLSVTEEGELREQMLSFYFRISAFLTVHEIMGEQYVIYGIPVGKRDYSLKLFCVNPAENLQKILDRARSTVFFSATLVPVNYYKKLLSTRNDDYAIAVPSPFPQSHRRILIGTDVSTRYTRRTEEEFRRIASYIAAAVSAAPGNYMVYFPSYKLLEDVGTMYDEQKGAQERVLLQRRDMTEPERREFLQEFRRTHTGTLTGFCVMGGSFSEGIDLRGRELLGAVIVGTGIPQVGTERELLKEYYGRDGFAYAYRIPGMNKVLQAAGRVIRTMDDRGWMLLLDERFARPEYRGCFPPSWDDRICCTVRDVGQKIREFWDFCEQNA